MALFNSLFILVLVLLIDSTHSFAAVKQKEASSYWTSQKAMDDTPSFLLDEIQKSPWKGGLEPAVDIPKPLECNVIQGKIPKDLHGTLFRNGPGRIRVGKNSLYKHWFDGDGYVVKLTLNGNQAAILQGKYVQTERIQNEEGNGEGGMTQRGAWTDAKNGKWFANLFKKPTNPGNTSCRVVKDKNGKHLLLALAEGGPPHLMDIKTLETLGYYDYDSPDEFGTPQDCASAHPVECPETGEMYTCGLRLGVPSAWPSLTQLKAFKFVPSTNGSLQLDATTTIEMPNISFVHDMCISEKHVAFVIPPYAAVGKDLLLSVLSTPPLGARFRWADDLKTRIVVLKRSDLSVVADVTTDEYVSLYHIVNAHDLQQDDGLLEIQIAAHNGPRENVENVFKNMYFQTFTDQERCRLRSIVIDKDKHVSVQDCGPDSASAFELPSVNPNVVGKSQRHVFTNCAYPSTSELVNCIERLDLYKNTVDRASFGPNRFAMEPVVVPKGNWKEMNELNAYVLSLVYNADEHATDCVILDAAKLSKGPLATIRLPSHVPYGFHGTWTNEVFL